MSDVPVLNVKDLYKRRQAKDAARLRAYNQILDTIYHRIRVQSNMPNSPCSLLYTIPPFILGLPKIDLEDCVVYLVYQLRQSGFEVRYSYPNLMSISWIHHEKSYITEQSPIMQAMLATHGSGPGSGSGSGPGSGPGHRSAAKKARAPPKPKASTVRFSMDSSAPSVGHVPAASEYVPPSAFLQTLDKPSKVASSPALSGGVVQTTQGGVLADLWKM